MTTLAAGLSYVDLEFQGQTGVLATGVLHGAEGVALVDPGPSTTLPVLRRALAARGFAPGDVRAIFLTHIHLDHAGATGSLCDECPDARVYVHARGAPHVIDPSKLLASARRLYQDDMDRLWGEVRPVPADRVHVLEVGEPGQPERLPLTIAGHEADVIWTPGHASHHVSCFLPASRVAFVGDTAGLCRQGSRVVLPATPPPDIDLDAWRDSTGRILAWNPDTLFLMHFGPHQVPRVHFQDLWLRLDDWSRRVRARIASPGAEADPAAAFMRDVSDELTRLVGRAETEAYAAAGRFDFSWMGLARYWTKRAGDARGVST
jgi:glyoxylase-like metal-dependent hydrolase (beta-lactamase superfamily II)